MPTSEKLAADARRAISSTKRLRDRIDSAVHELVAGTTLYREYPELGEAVIIVTGYQQFVHVMVEIGSPKLHILPVTGRRPMLGAFVTEVRAGLEKIAADHHLTVNEKETNAVYDGAVEQLQIGWSARLDRPLR
jgi:hypothetical protein